jgi:hypothetical protein
MMFQGTMIDELISTVERAEQNTRRQHDQNASATTQVWNCPAAGLEWRGISEVA